MNLARLGFILAATCCGVASAQVAQPLPIGTSLDIEMRPGEERLFDLPAAPGFRGMRLVATERGVDISLQLQSGGKTLVSNDGDFLRTGDHLLALSLEPGQGGAVKVTATRPGSRGGHVVLRAEWLDLGDEKAARAYSADLLETDVARRTNDKSLAMAPESVEAARQLLTLRRALDDGTGAIHALFKLDQLLRMQNRRPEQIALLEESLPWLRIVGNATQTASAYNNIGMSQWRLGNLRAADAPLRQALATMDRSDDDLMKALVDSNFCLVVMSRRSVDENVACSARNVELSRATGDYARLAVAWNNLAGARSLAGQSGQAADGYLEAVKFGELAGGRAIADPLMNLGLERMAQGRYEDALELYTKAEALYRRDGNQRNLALLLRHRGRLDLLLGNRADGERLLREALATQRRVGNAEDIVQTLMLIGEMERRDAREAIIPDAYAEAVKLSDEKAGPQMQANTLSRFVQALVDARRYDEAQRQLVRLQALADSLRNDYLRSGARLQQARLLLARGQATVALARIREAMRLARALSLPVDLAEMHALEARSLVELHRPREAAEAYARGIVFVERARDGIRDAEQRARFVATRRELYEGRAVLVTEEALKRDDSDLRLAALAVVADQRSRSLSEEIGLRTGEVQIDTTEYRRLASREVDLASARWLARERGLGAQTLEQVDDELRDVSSRLARLERSGRGDAMRSREMAAIVDAQSRRTTVVHYFVATNGSYAWIVRDWHSTLVRLPPRKALEDLVAAAHKVMTSGDTSGMQVFADLCNAVWAPLGYTADERGVLLIPDGPLHAVPWSALQCGDATASRSLIDDAEIRLAPSLRVVDEIQRRRPQRKDMPSRVLAVVDPVYGGDDARIANAAAAPRAADSALPLARLQASGREAQTLESLASGDVTVLSGAGADRDAFLGLPLNTYRLIHLGMHGFAGTDSLTASGIVFSLFDASGKPISGFLNARSIARLRLDADLVVVAACDSAAGASLPGEGVLGTHYAFLAAGADQVIAALTPVSDAITSQLMEALYGHIIRDGMSPSDALRSAQMEIRRSPFTRHPRYWAGFIAYGDGAAH